MYMTDAEIVHVYRLMHLLNPVLRMGIKNPHYTMVG